MPRFLERDAITRDFAEVDLEIRNDGLGRTIHGIVVPFGQVARVSDDGRNSYDEMFRQGSFTKALAEQRGPVRLLSQHNSTQPIGRAEDMREDAVGLYGSFRVSNTAYANDQLELVRDNVLRSFSVGFIPSKHSRENGVTVRTEVGIREVSLVTFPAYVGAAVAGVRAVADAVMEMDPEQRAELARLFAAGTPLEPSASGTPDPGAAADEQPTGHSDRQYTPDELRTMIRARIALRSAL